MKKMAIYYSVVWFISLVIFNVITFVTATALDNDFNAGFWIGYIFITAVFLLHLACNVYAFVKNDLKRTFYHLPLASISYTCLIIMLIVGGVSMAVSANKPWVAMVVCAVILAFNIIALVKATAAAALVSDVDARVAGETALIHKLTNEARAVVLSTNNDALQTEAKRIYEALRYSDPTDHEDLAELNWQIKGGLNAFSAAVKKEDGDLAAAEAQNLLALLESRNMQLKASKK